MLSQRWLVLHAGACSIEAGTQFTNADIAVIYNIADAQSCCQFCQGFSTISAVPCGGYSFCASCPDGKANICALKGCDICGWQGLAACCGVQQLAAVTQQAACPAVRMQLLHHERQPFCWQISFDVSHVLHAVLLPWAGPAP